MDEVSLVKQTLLLSVQKADMYHGTFVAHFSHKFSVNSITDTYPHHIESTELSVKTCKVCKLGLGKVDCMCV